MFSHSQQALIHASTCYSISQIPGLTITTNTSDNAFLAVLHSATEKQQRSDHNLLHVIEQHFLANTHPFTISSATPGTPIVPPRAPPNGTSAPPTNAINLLPPQILAHYRRFILQSISRRKREAKREHPHSVAQQHLPMALHYTPRTPDHTTADSVIVTAVHA